MLISFFKYSVYVLTKILFSHSFVRGENVRLKMPLINFQEIVLNLKYFFLCVTPKYMGELGTDLKINFSLNNVLQQVLSCKKGIYILKIRILFSITKIIGTPSQNRFWNDQINIDFCPFIYFFTFPRFSIVHEA